MPLYSYACQTCSKRFTRLLPLARYDEPQVCECGGACTKLLSAPAVRADYAGYACPITGSWIEGRQAHKENLARHGCRVLEAGETEQAVRAREASENRLADSVAETAERLVYEMPSEKRERLGREIESGLDISVERR